MKSGNFGIAWVLAAILFPSREEKREGVGPRGKRNNYLSSHNFNRILGVKARPHYTPSLTRSANMHAQIQMFTLPRHTSTYHNKEITRSGLNICRDWLIAIRAEWIMKGICFTCLGVYFSLPHCLSPGLQESQTHRSDLRVETFGWVVALTPRLEALFFQNSCSSQK